VQHLLRTSRWSHLRLANSAGSYTRVYSTKGGWLLHARNVRQSPASGTSTPQTSVPPEVLEPRWCQLSVTHGVLDILMAEVGLKRPGVHSVVGQLKPTGMA
jgi:hypothetical protein